ncbi:zinc metalloproteinase nas-7, partial [Exaiptasia diaphana]|uniref:Metalloendopeptidase n=1 Tax=Exaiptasia diaphana TaxID=2652724 RepID=A0A913WZR1_EXADI
MIYRLFLVALALFVCCKMSTFANPIIRTKGEAPDIEEIANREYDTVHGRILAVNMATLRKRRLQGTPENPFERIENIDEDDDLNLYQGDIQLDEDSEELLHMPNRTISKRNGISRKAHLWTSRRIPYLVPGHMAHIKGKLLTAFSHFHKHTCIRFVPYQPGRHKNYIMFDDKKGCSSAIGRAYHITGAQRLSLGSGCQFVGTIIHELLHAVGFWHEQARPDRDKYVKIYWENISKGNADQFTKITSVDTLGTSYDYDSIMHYDRTAFSKNGKPTIVAIGDEKRKFGSRLLSTKDIIEINALYDCK